MPLNEPQLWSDDERWQVLMDSVKDFGIFLIDCQGDIATWSCGATRLLGFSNDEIVGKPYRLIFTAEDLSKDQPDFELREAREKGRSEDERWHQRRDGTRFWASGVVTPLWSATGDLRGYAKVLRDITARKMSELATVEANRVKDEFLAILSHEFRNPLAAILSATELFKAESQSNETVEEAAAVVERQARTLVRMVDDLLDVSRISSGKLQLQRQRVELGELVSQALEASQPAITSRGHVVHLNASTEKIWLECDPIRISQMLANILVNAAKYTEPGGQITVTSKLEGNQAVVRVLDNGSGIISEMLPRIFEPFVQADRSSDRSNGGLGIGLCLVKRILEMHGGKVEAFSEGIGKGSEFVVTLPASVQQTPETKSPPTSDSAAATATLKIIIAEDNPDTARTLAILLRRFGHQVTTVATGPEALKQAEELLPDVMIVDIGLPGMDGHKVAEMIRSQEKMRAVRLIAVTGYAQAEDQDRAYQAGFDHHLAKPVEFKMLIDLLHRK